MEIIKNKSIIQRIVKYISMNFLGLFIFQMDPDLEIAVLKFHDFSRFFMSVYEPWMWRSGAVI